MASSTSSVTVAPSRDNGAPGPSGDQAVPSQAQSPSVPMSAETTDPQPVTSVPTTTAAAPTADHPVAGTPFPGEGLTAQQASDLQNAVNDGHQPWRLDELQVAKSFVQARFGWADAQARTGPVAAFVIVTGPDGSQVAVHCVQPVTQGSHGIWVVESGTWN
ncbi:acyl transferase [Nocardia sp. NPDC088792]|uniref:acyl transferase n=1 Tax=Nocardia sp. NPDC088792 TaxID=3364332 RepID=UPI003829A7B6